MKYKMIGDSLNVSVLGLGTWGLGGGTSWSDTDDEQSIRIVHKAKDLGINLVDTAPSYGTGHSEEVVGQALKGRRGDYILSTKCTMQWRTTEGVKMYSRDGKNVYKCFTPDSLRMDLESSLKRLQTDYIDIFFTHRQPDDLKEIESVYETLARFKEEGKIRAIGISNASAAILAEYLKYGPVDVVQEKYSLLDQKHRAVYLPFCVENKVAFQGFSVLERGLLTGKIGMDYELAAGEARNTIQWFQPARRRIALDMLQKLEDICRKYECSMTNLIMAATLNTSANFCALFGVRKLKNLEDTVLAADITLEEEDYRFIEQCCADACRDAAALEG